MNFEELQIKCGHLNDLQNLSFKGHELVLVETLIRCCAMDIVRIWCQIWVFSIFDGFKPISMKFTVNVVIPHNSHSYRFDSR